LRSEIALVRATIFGKSGEWLRTTGIPLNGADQLFFTSAPTTTPPSLERTECQLSIVTKDEMVG